LRSISAPERRLGRAAVARAELAEIDTGAMDADSIGGHAQRDHVALHRRRHREQPVGVAARRAHLAAGRRRAAPEMDIGAARLDRHRHAELPPHRDRRGPVGEEERRIDHVEREIAADVGEQRRERAAQRGDVKATPRAGHREKARAIDVEVLPLLAERQSGERGVAAGQPEREGGQADRRDDAKLDLRVRGKPKRLSLDENPEISPGGIGKQGGERQNAKHGAHP
jgi:hypothetical protein